jgi:hypothetical protein
MRVSDNYTPLHECCRWGHAGCARVLLGLASEMFDIPQQLLRGEQTSSFHDVYSKSQQRSGGASGYLRLESGDSGAFNNNNNNSSSRQSSRQSSMSYETNSNFGDNNEFRSAGKDREGLSPLLVQVVNDETCGSAPISIAVQHGHLQVIISSCLSLSLYSLVVLIYIIQCYCI